MRHVLLCSLGLSPAVITETLWALLQPGNPVAGGGEGIVFDKVHVVTTAQPDDARVGPPVPPALRQIADDLRPGDAEPGYRIFAARRVQLAERIATLHAAHAAPPPDLIFEGVRDASGRYLSDISTAEHNVLFAEHLMRTVLRYVRKGEPTDEEANAWPFAEGGEDDPETILHVSLAGGRKTMSSNTQAAMSFFGRIQDRLTHVLVHPERYERDSSFWWPGSDGVGTEATVDLVPVPFVPLRSGLARTIKAEDINLMGVQRAGELEMADRVNGLMPLMIDVPDRSIRYGNHVLTLNENEAEALAFLVRARTDEWEVEGYEGRGWVANRYVKASPDFERVRAFGKAAKLSIITAKSPRLGLRTDPDEVETSLIDRHGEGDNLRSALSTLQKRLRTADLYLANRLQIDRRSNRKSGSTANSVYRLRADATWITLKGIEQ